MKEKFWHRYLDKVFTIWTHGTTALTDFLSHLISRHPNIKFSTKMGRNHQLRFLGVFFNCHHDISLTYSVYRNCAHTSHLQAASHHQQACKKSDRSIIITKILQKVIPVLLYVLPEPLHTTAIAHSTSLCTL